MQSIGPPSHQPYTGQIKDKDRISSRLPLIGQMNPVIETRWRLSQGRAVAGLGSVPESYQEERRDDYIGQIEQEDDVLGSGIFDMSGRMATIHPQLGVFADHPSLPGYLAREVQFAVSKDIEDITAGAQVVAVPGGGMAYVERGGRNVGPLQTDDHLNPYVVLDRGQRAPAGPVRVAEPPAQSVPKALPDGGTRLTRSVPQPVPEAPSSDKFSATDPQYGTAFQQNMPINGFGAPILPWRGPVGGVGETEPTQPGWGSFLIAGGVIGVSVALLLGTTHMPRRRRSAR
jgi:hypothetical protein